MGFTELINMLHSQSIAPHIHSNQHYSIYILVKSDKIQKIPRSKILLSILCYDNIIDWICGENIGTVLGGNARKTNRLVFGSV